MAIGTAREHVRVARGLRALPRTRELLGEGRLTYSKVREITRIAELMDEEKLCALALEMTASQLARTVRAYRAAPGTRIGQESRRTLSWHESDDGMIRLSVRLPAEEAAVVRSALDVAIARGAPESDEAESGTSQGQSEPDCVQALVDIAAGYLAADEAELADDRHLVVVHVSADQLTNSADAIAAMPANATDTADGYHDVPAGTTEQPRADHQESFIDDAGPGRAPIEAATAARLACTSRLIGVLIDRHGNILAMGRTTRRATRAQRRALRIRDHGRCQFPGCHATRHLDAHHILPWYRSGPTDLDNLILLCRRHHTCCHEGGITIQPRPGGPAGRWEFRMPDGSTVQPPAAWHTPDSARHQLIRQLHKWFETQQHQPPRVFPQYAGAGFSLHDCAAVLFNITTPEEETPAAA